MRQLIITTLVLALSVAGVCADEDARPSDAAIEEAVTILEARMAQTENKEDKDKITKAISELNKLLSKGKKEGAEAGAELGELITPARLKKKLAGKATYNPKSGELTLVYNFSSKDQLKDFDLKEAKPTLKAGVLHLRPSDGIEHVAKFKTLKVSGHFAVENVGAGSGFQPYLRTTDGVSFGSGESNGASLTLSYKDKQLGIKPLPRNQIEGILIAVTLTVTKQGATVKAGNIELGGQLEANTAGQVELLGAIGGVRVQSLVISGIPDSEWAKEFFKE